MGPSGHFSCGLLFSSTQRCHLMAAVSYTGEAWLCSSETNRLWGKFLSVTSHPGRSALIAHWRFSSYEHPGSSLLIGSVLLYIYIYIWGSRTVCATLREWSWQTDLGQISVSYIPPWRVIDSLLGPVQCLWNTAACMCSKAYKSWWRAENGRSWFLIEI